MPSAEQKKNYEYFQKQLPELLDDPLKAGKYVIVHEERIKAIYDTFEAAYSMACQKFDDSFIIQQIIDERKIVNYLSPAVV